MTNAILIQLLLFGFTLWLGLYLIARDPDKPSLRYTGLGLAAYAGWVAVDFLLPLFNHEPVLLALRGVLMFAPALCWFTAAVDLLPENAPVRVHLSRLRGYGLIAGLALLIVMSGLPPAATPLFLIAAFMLGLLLLAALLIVYRAYRAAPSHRALGALLIVAIFFGLSNALLLLPLLPPIVTLLLIGLDIILLGACIAVLDAFDEGETLLPDALRSLAASLLLALIFGGQVTLLMLGSGASAGLIALLFGMIGAAVAVQVFADGLQSVLDRLVFARFPRLRRARADLRAAASALPRADESLQLDSLDDDTFARLTRRALSHMGDLGRLAASPLLQLSLIDTRLAGRGDADSTLERAAELKTLLTERITRLKPRDKGDFGTTDEWRYYNALYYPYVLGLKPYSRGGFDDPQAAVNRAALEWFQTMVPERTLHNWQNAAARLVAQDLREQLRQNGTHSGFGANH